MLSFPPSIPRSSFIAAPNDVGHCPFVHFADSALGEKKTVNEWHYQLVIVKKF